MSRPYPIAQKAKRDITVVLKHDLNNGKVKINVPYSFRLAIWMEDCCQRKYGDFLAQKEEDDVAYNLSEGNVLILRGQDLSNIYLMVRNKHNKGEVFPFTLNLEQFESLICALYSSGEEFKVKETSYFSIL